MSGIVGIFNRDGAPADRALLQFLAQFLSFRGPDAREVWSDGPVGFGHTLLRTTRESLNERQPAGLEGRFWITADIRLDCRTELLSELETQGRKVHRPITDPELILHAYAAWGEECVQHLRGDFAFAIWDVRQRQLFCARDHFGIKPFYYAELSELFLFSNTLKCVRLHPGISGELNEAAIADFLLFGLNCDAATTTFRDIHRLPPAHCMTVSREGTRIRRYWTAPIDGRIRYRHADEYVEHFQVLMQAAVADRLRTDRAGLLLSGGLDSGAIAATAQELSTSPGGAADLRAYTITYESLIPDTDAHHARLTAEFLRIPIQCLAFDGLSLFDRWDDEELAWPEPVDDPLLSGLFDQFGMIAKDCRVVLTGDGGDNLMHFQMLPYVKDLVQRREWKRLICELPRYLRVRPSPAPGVRRRIKGLFGRDASAAVFPNWLAPDFARRMNLADRWREWIEVSAPLAHPIVPKAHASLYVPQWAYLFELQDPGVTHCAVEVRNPFLDLRVVEYILALPPFPWFFEKTLLREAMVGRMAEAVRVRRKTPLEGDPLVANLRMGETAWLEQVQWTEEFDRYVDRRALDPSLGKKAAEEATVNIRPYCLNFWLQSARRVRYNLRAETWHG
ncbi:MAG: asparagine synthase-related protein [Candidatus Acidiferrales bacterium]